MEENNHEQWSRWTEDEKIDFADQVRKLDIRKDALQKIERKFKQPVKQQEIRQSLLASIVDKDQPQYMKFQKVVGKQIFQTLLKAQEQYNYSHSVIKSIEPEGENMDNEYADEEDESEGLKDLLFEYMGNFYTALGHEYQEDLNDIYVKFMNGLKEYVSNSPEEEKIVNSMLTTLYGKDHTQGIDALLVDLIDMKIIPAVWFIANQYPDGKQAMAIYMLIGNYINYLMLTQNKSNKSLKNKDLYQANDNLINHLAYIISLKHYDALDEEDQDESSYSDY